MYIKDISLVNFKNYYQAEIELSPKINCFVGDNGVGKTNLLDAIHYLSFCKSHFNSIDSQNITTDENFFVIQGKYERLGEDEIIYCGLKENNRKIFKRNKKEYQRLADHIGIIPLVMKSPSDANFIYQGSDERRKFIDSVISQFDKEYLDDLIKYNRILLQRNKLLKSSYDRNFSSESIEIYNNQLDHYGSGIYSKRVDFINNIQPIFSKYYEEISGGNESVELVFKSQLSDGKLSDLLRESINKDKVLQYTTAGIHKDDIVMMMNGKVIRKFGSQGQQKTYLIALKFSQYDFIKKETGINPLLLLDDIFDKLDIKRVQQIIKMVTGNHFGQIFITDTSHDRLKDILQGSDNDYKIFLIEDGEVRSV